MCLRLFERMGAAHRAAELLEPFQQETPRNLMIDAAKQRAAGILFSNTSDALERMFTEYRL